MNRRHPGARLSRFALAAACPRTARPTANTATGEAMPRYLVYGVVTGLKYLGTFEAETPEAAEDQAIKECGDQLSAHLCHQCGEKIDLDPDITEFKVEED